MPLAALSLSGSKGSSFHKTKSFQLAVDVDISTRKLRYPGARWHGEKKSSERGCQVWIDALVDSVMLEVAVGVIISADLILTIMTFTMSEETSESTLVFVVGAIFLIVLLVDVLLRVAKYRLLFFHRPLNWLEFIVALAGCVMLVFEGVERTNCGGPCNNNRGGAAGGGTSLGRGIRPTIKAWRIVRTAMQLANSRGGLHKQIDRQTDRFTSRLIRLYLNDFFLIPRQNVYMKLSQGMLHLEKAQVRSSVLKGLHLPLTISCGIIDLVHVKVSLSGSKDEPTRGGGEESGHKLLVVVENALIVVGPGHHQEEPAPPWDFETVLERKKKLIDLLTRRLEAGAKHKVAAAAAKGGTKMSSVSKKLKQRLVSHVEEILARGVHISIANLEVRFEDGLGQVTNGAAVVGGLRIGVLTLRAAGAAEGEELEEEKDFRVRGRWRHGLEEERTPGMGSSVWETDSPVSDRELTKSSRRLGKFTRATKRRLRQGVRMALQADRICAFWDMSEMGAEVNRHSVAARYSDMLEEGSGIDINNFLAEHALTRRRERFRLALCKEVESRMVHSVGRCAAREIARRLRDRVAAHKYIIMPFGCSVHAVVRPPTAPEGSPRGKCLPHVDVSMEMSTISLTPDMAQAANVAWMADYLKRWFQEDKRFQWKPPTVSFGQERTSRAYARWTYALQRILVSIDPSHAWRSLSWIGMQRRCTYRAAYLASLTSTSPPNQEKIAVLQVALPLPEVLSLRKDAAFCVALRQRSKRNPLEGSLGDFLREGPKGARDVDGAGLQSRNSGLDVDLESGYSRSSSSGRMSKRSKASAKEDSGGKMKFRLAEMSVQVHASVGTVQMGVLSRETFVFGARRPVVLGQAIGFSVSAALGAPRGVWLRLAPPSASAEMDPEAQPQGVVFELSIDTVRAVFYAAPSAAWQLRRVLFCGGGQLGPRGGRPDDDRQLLAGASGAGVGGIGVKRPSSKEFARGSRGSSVEKALLEAGIRIRGADVGFVQACRNWHQVPKRHWVVAACVPALEVHVLKPLIQALVRTVRPPKPPPAVLAAAAAARARAEAAGKTPRSARSGGGGAAASAGNYKSGGSSSSTKFHTTQLPPDANEGTQNRAQARDSALFWADLLEASRQRADRAVFERKRRLNEKLTGTSGFMKGGLVTGSVLFLGGLRADVLDSCTKDHWLLQAVHLPAGTATVSRGGLPPHFQVGFRPLGNVPDGCLVQAEDGWWFETKAQAQAMAKLLNPDRERTSHKSEGSGGEIKKSRSGGGSIHEESCAGPDAVEGPGEEAAPLKEARETPRGSSAWTKATVCALSYKPRISERGLLPTSCSLSLSPRRISASPVVTTLPFCCQDVNLACMKSVAASKKNFSAVLPSDRILKPSSLLPAITPAVFLPTAAPAKTEQSGMRSWAPPPEEQCGDHPISGVDVWLETLTPAAVGLPKPEKIEELWLRLGCTPRASSAHLICAEELC